MTEEIRDIMTDFTEITVSLVELPALYAGTLSFDLAESTAPFERWIDWTATAPDSVTTSGRILRFPDIEQVPPPQRGKHLFSLHVAYPGPADEGERLAASLRELGTVYVDQLGPLPIAEVARISDDPAERRPVCNRGMMLAKADHGFAETLLALVGPDSELPIMGAWVRHLGGATRADVDGGSAVGYRDFDFALTAFGVPDPALFGEVLPRVFARFEAALAPWVSPHTTPNWINDPRRGPRSTAPGRLRPGLASTRCGPPTTPLASSPSRPAGCGTDEERDMADLVDHPEQGAEAERHAPVGDPIPDPGLADSGPRFTDVEPRARRRAERQVAGMFTVASLLVVASIAVYVVSGADVGEDVDIGDLQVTNLALGLTLGSALLLVGAGAVQWSRTLMTSPEVTESRRNARAAADLREPVSDGVGADAHKYGIGRRTLVRNSLMGALALLPLPAVVLLRDLGPAPGGKREHTMWAEGVRLLTDVTYTPIRAADLEIGQLVSVMPSSFLDLPDHGPARQNERARSPVMLVRIRPDEIVPAAGRENWHVDGILAYSKICTHVGCPTSLYERTTHHALCPCHQSTFDLADHGAVVFGPATRALPQLPLAVDDDGFLVARSDFTEPVGPGYWERTV
ncbi:MAG: cytochrome bc1 complex Rieske iron-sulfur subunit [Jiangellaceae bacterium]